MERTAIHESGHAIAAVHYGVPYAALEMTIECRDGLWYCWGRLRGTEGPEPASNDDLSVQLTVVMAGYAAESLHKPSGAFSLDIFKTPDDRDFNAALEILQSLRPPVTDAAACAVVLERAWHHARALLTADWSRVLVLANELIRLSVRDGEVVEGVASLRSAQVLQLLSASRGSAA